MFCRAKMELNNNMKNWIIGGLLLFIVGCSSDSKYSTELEEVRAGLNDNPSMALSKLDSLKACWGTMPKNIQMRWQLLQLSAQNKCDTVFRSDSVQQVLVDYFECQGTPNERMYANYLLGRVYSDMGEAPQALKWFQKAVESADTTDTDCDYYTLCGIYGQIARTFDQQNLYYEEIEAWESFSHFALKDSDTYNYIRGIEFQEIPYFCLDDTFNLMKTTEKARQLYLKNGWKESAASVYPPAILLMLQDGQYQRAHDMMQVFEHESGLFDASGNISSGREHYYNSKGLYYLGVHQLDSAEHYFRKLIPFEINRNYDAYDGLHAVYRAQRDVDSVMKYAALSEQALDSIQKDDQADALAIAHSLYNYSRMERMMEQENFKTQQMKWRNTLAMIAGLVVLLLVVLRYRKYKKTKENELKTLSKDYQDKVERLEQARRDLVLLEEDKNRLAKERRDEIRRLQEEIDRYKELYERVPIHEREMSLAKSPIVNKFHERGKGKLNIGLPSDNDWIKLGSAYHEQLPSFYTSILQDARLSDEEKHLCMLCRLNFHNGEIAVLLDKSPQSVSNMKSAVNDKLFGMKTAGELNANLKRL